MSRRRYVSTKISTDKQVNKLATQYGDFAALLFTWMIPHAEDNCEITGDPEELMTIVCPGRRDKSVNDVMVAIDGMVELDLIIPFHRNENPMLFFPPESFYNYQTYVSAKNRCFDAKEQRETPKNAEEHKKIAQNTVSPSLSPSLLKDMPAPDGTSESVEVPAEKLPLGSGAQETGKDGYTSEFKEFWEIYPRTVEKRAAFAAWNARLNDKKDKTTPEVMIIGARNYAAECLKLKTEVQYIKHPATFLSSKKPFEEYAKMTLPNTEGKTCASADATKIIVAPEGWGE